MTWHPNKPYNELPNLPPLGIDLETHRVLKHCIDARASLASLKHASQLIPNETILISIIPLLEAKDSVEIENIITTTDKLFQYSQDDKHADGATKEALRYRSALYEGYQSLKNKPLCTTTAVEICRTLKKIDIDIRDTPGTQLINDRTQKVIYTPPEGENLLRDKLANWEQFLHGTETIDPLVRMAVGHYQFEAIHPFADGNGRTGRIINILFLIQAGLLDLPILYLSRYINTNKGTYYDLLLKVTQNQDWESWIIFMLTAIKNTADWTREKIIAMRELAEHTRQYIQKKLPRIYSYELVETIFEKPYCRIIDIIDKNIAKRQAASSYFKELTKLGILTNISMGRENLWVHTKLMDLLKQDSNQWVPYE